MKNEVNEDRGKPASAYPLRMYAVVIPGMESLAADELAELSAHAIQPDEGGVAFSGTWDTLFRVNLRSRLITRILLRLGKFQAERIEQFEKAVAGLDWQHYLNGKDLVNVEVSSHQSRLRHTRMLQQAVLKVVKPFTVNQKSADSATSQTVFVRLNNNRCVISLDTSGERLDRRGYRVQSVAAPVRETIAAGVLRWMNWQAEIPLINPMCGSGTIAIEAAMMARNLSPSLQHSFPFISWPCLKPRIWKKSLDKAQQLKGNEPLAIRATDISQQCVSASRENAGKAGVSSSLVIGQQDCFDMDVSAMGLSQGLMICNPPYGQRLQGDARGLYHRLGRWFEAQGPGWQMALFSPDKGCSRALALPVKRSLQLRHGGKWIEVLHL